MSAAERRSAAANGRGPEDDAAREAGLVETAAGLARIYASAWLNTAGWTVETSLSTATRLMRIALGSDRPGALLEDTIAEMREYARRLLEIVDSDGRVPSSLSDLVSNGAGSRRRHDSSDTLRARGEELLRRSADVDYDEQEHPAYDRILSELVPDEGRILRLMATEGPQPAVDVRTGLPMLSELVAPGRSMIGAEAGARHPERVPAYLNNLYRLGLIWFSREPVRDHMRYQVLEAQPDVLDALKKGGRLARTVRRSILLTPFGKDFCELALPLDTAELEALDAQPTAPAAEAREEAEPTPGS